MRHCFLIIGLLIVCSTFLYGQDNILICSKEVSNSAERTNEILRKNATYTSVEFVEINFDKMLEYEEFLLKFDRRNILVKKERIEARGVNNFVFVGSNDKGDCVLISVLGDDIQGVIEADEEVFTIETVGQKQYALITIDHSMLREACDYLDVDIYHPIFEEVNSNNHKLNTESRDDMSFLPILKATSVYDCKIRVLVLYTPEAQSLVSNVKNTILTAVALTNQSFVNSQINYRIELVYAGQTNYTESGFSTDLSRFRTSGDGYMDEVHSLRNKYSADVCVLLISDSLYCGLASGIGVSAANAFCAVSTKGTCATTNYSFAHEIGHLLGCRHDPYVDNSSTPYAFGHGYVNPSNTWRTIMAYKNACGSCPRLLYWSNPNVNYNGEPMGTIANNNNTRVWNERSNTVMAFRQPEDNVTFTSSDMPNNTKYADVIAKQKITTSGTVNTNSENTLNMRAGNSILLQPGFSVQAGATFSARIEDIGDCEECALAASKVMVQNVPEVSDEKADAQFESKSIIQYTVFPNSSCEFINITYSLDLKMTVSIEMLDLFGQKMKTILPKQNHQAGNYSLQIPVSDFSNGTYFLTISSEYQTIIKRIVINK